MIFRRLASQKEIEDLPLKVKDFFIYKEWWAVTITEEDVKHNIHIFNNPKHNELPRGWQLLDSDTCLESFSNKVLESGYQAPKNGQQVDYDKIRKISGTLDYEKLIKYNNNSFKKSQWAFASYNKNGPFMITDGVHRLIGVFINNFLLKKDNIFPFEHAICGIIESNTSNFDIPEYFCPRLIE